MGDVDKNQTKADGGSPKTGSGGKAVKGLVAVAALAAAAWAGGWFFVKGKIPQALAQQTAALKAQGLDVTHGPVTVSGFPFKHNARIENVVVSSSQPQGGLAVKSVTTIPWVEGSWAMFSPSKGQLTAVADTSKVEVTVGERKLAGDLKLANLRGSVDGSGAQAVYDLAADSMGLELAGPAGGPESVVPGLRSLSIQSGAVAWKGVAGAGAANFEQNLANLVATIRSEVPNPDFTQEGLVPNVTTVELPSLIAKGSVEGETRKGETLLPPTVNLRIKTGEAQELAFPIHSTNARLSFTDTPSRVDFAMTGDSLSYAMTQDEGFFTLATDSRYGKFDFKGYLDKASIAEFDPAKLEAGVVPDVSKINFRLEYKGDDSAVVMKATPKESAEPDPFSSAPPIPAFDLDVKSGPGAGVVALEQGRLDISASSKANVFAFSGPADVSGEIGDLVAKIQGPLTKGDAPQPFALEYDFDKVTLNEGAWDQIDPTGALDRQINRLRIAISGDLTLNASMGDDESLRAAAEAGKEPVFPNSVKIDDVTIDALGLVAKATGQAAFDPANPNAPPTGEGRVSLKNWQPFLNSLVNAGLAPPDALAMAEGMIGMLGEEGSEGDTVFRIAVGSDGVLNVNDNPMGEIPGVGGPSGPGFEEDFGDEFNDEEWPSEEEVLPEEELPLDGELPSEGVEEQELQPLTPPAPTPAPAPAPAEEGGLEQLQQDVEGGLRQLQEGVESGAEHLGHGAGELGQQLEEGAGEAGRQIQEGLGEAGQRIQEGVEHLEHGAGELGQQIQEGLGEAGQQIQEGAGEAGQRIQEGVEGGLEQLQEGAGELGQQIQEGAGEAGQRIQQGVEHLEQGAGDLERRLQEGLQRLEEEVAPAPAAPAAPAETAPAQ